MRAACGTIVLAPDITSEPWPRSPVCSFVSRSAVCDLATLPLRSSISPVVTSQLLYWRRRARVRVVNAGLRGKRQGTTGSRNCIHDLKQ